MTISACYSITRKTIREHRQGKPLLLIDSHSHFDDPRLDDSRERDFLEARGSGVIQQVIPATTMKSWTRLRDICNKYKGLFAAYGLHPYYLEEHRTDHLDLLKTWLEQNTTVALGECGLDNVDKTLNKEAQAHFFREQLAIASECGLPVILHANRASEEVIQHLRKSEVRNGVVHSFNGSKVQANRLIDLGFLLSFGGVITYPRARKLRELVSCLPLDALMIETDAPDQPSCKHKGELNKPAYLLDVFASVCTLRKESPENLAEQLNKNARQLFKLPAFTDHAGDFPSNVSQYQTDDKPRHHQR